MASADEFMREESKEAAPAAAPSAPADLRVRGRTYEVREQLKSIGCRWDGSAWVASSPAMLDQANQIVAGQKLAPPPADLRAASTRDLVVELISRADWVQALGKDRMTRALRAMGQRVGEEVRDTLGDLLIGDPPSIDELADAIEKLERER